jgi:hypothetical protein
MALIQTAITGKEFSLNYLESGLIEFINKALQFSISLVRY